MPINRTPASKQGLTLKEAQAKTGIYPLRLLKLLAKGLLKGKGSGKAKRIDEASLLQLTRKRK